MTVGRRAGVYVYGSFSVTIPQDRQREEKDTRLQDGFVYRPDNPPRGRFDVAFVRADATIDLDSGTSNLEQVIDTAQKRVEGDVFFEQDITGSGLGQYRPGVDYQTGDVVDVVIWGKRLPVPVTAIDMTGGFSWRVHVGGQLIADAEGLKQHNDQLLQQIAQDKRQLSQQVERAQSSANTAHGTAVAAQSTADTAQENAITALQRQQVMQQQWNREREEVDRRQDTTDETLLRMQPKILGFTATGAESEYVSVTSGSNLHVTARGSWTGVMVVVSEVAALANYTITKAVDVTSTSRRFSWTVGTAERTAGGFVLIFPK